MRWPSATFRSAERNNATNDNKTDSFLFPISWARSRWVLHLALPLSFSHPLPLSLSQVYNDQIHDLQSTGELVDLPFKRGLTGGYAIKNLTSTPIKSKEEALNIITAGNEKRTTRAMTMNEMSSRSHAIVILNVQFCPEVTMFPLSPSPCLSHSRAPLIAPLGSHRALLSFSHPDRHACRGRPRRRPFPCTWLILRVPKRRRCRRPRAKERCEAWLVRREGFGLA